MDFSKSDDNLIGKYKQVYGETLGEEKLKEYIYYQKLIHDAKVSHKNKRKQKETTEQEVIVEDEED